MKVFDRCFNMDHDPYRCSKFKIGFWDIGDQCETCSEFIFINWEALDLPKESTIRLYWRLKKLTNPQELKTGLYYAEANNDKMRIELIRGLINETVHNNQER